MMNAVKEISDLDFLNAYVEFRKEMLLTFSGYIKNMKMGIKQMGVMLYLAKHKKATATELADNADSDLAAMSRALKSLEKNGYIRRSEHPTDNRKAYLELSEKGLVKAQETEIIRQKIAAHAVLSMDMSERREFMRLFQKAAHSLKLQREEL